MGYPIRRHRHRDKAGYGLRDIARLDLSRSGSRGNGFVLGRISRGSKASSRPRLSSLPETLPMSLVHTPVLHDNFLFHRKRTASFSVASTSLAASPRPAKSQRTATMPLRRSESYLSLPTVASSLVVISAQGSCRPAMPTVPYQQSLQYYKEQRHRRKAATRASLSLDAPITIKTRLERTCSQLQSSHQPHLPFRAIPPASSSPAKTRSLTRSPPLDPINDNSFRVPVTCRASSPLSPKRHLLPGRPVFPRSKPEPDLYRLAIKTCMRYSPEGQKILRMGPRLALSILTATQDLERMVAEQESRDDIIIEERAPATTTTVLQSPSAEKDDHSYSIISAAWVDLKNDDWEMADDDA